VMLKTGDEMFKEKEIKRRRGAKRGKAIII
jgi:hypothetical protein